MAKPHQIEIVSSTIDPRTGTVLIVRIITSSSRMLDLLEQFMGADWAFIVNYSRKDYTAHTLTFNCESKDHADGLLEAIRQYCEQLNNER